MTIFIDLAGSWIVRASMITVMLGVSVTMNDALYKTTQQANTNAAVASVAEIMYTDINLAGYNTYHVYYYAFESISSTYMRFHGDLNNGGYPETIRYKATLDAITGLYKLERRVDNEAGDTYFTIGDGFTSIKFQYYDYRGVLTSNYWEVASVRIKLVKPIPGATSGFTTALNDFKVYPANI
jgi:hypothetical protein